MGYKISQTGIDLIKSFEGCKLTAYKPVATEPYYTIGYGHYGADVKKGMTITQAQAEAFLKADLAKFEKAVNGYNLSWMNQNRFDALVSFTYNCGAGNLKTLLDSGKRTAEQVSAKIPAYNKSSGKVLAGLTRRRAAERELFDKAMATTSKVNTTAATSAQNKIKGMSVSAIRSMQTFLNAMGFTGKDGKQLSVDGKTGTNTFYSLDSFVDWYINER